MDAVTYKGGAGRICGPVSLSVRAGEIVGLLGPNGAGKTSLLKTIGGDCMIHRGGILAEGSPEELQGLQAD